MPGLQQGDVCLLTYRGTLFGQRVMTVLRFYVTTASARDTVIEDLADVAEFYQDTANELTAAYLEALTGQVTVAEVRAQRIYPTRSIYMSKVIDEVGVNPGTAETANICGVLTKRSALAGRHGVGSVHFPGLSATDCVDGTITGGYQTKMGLFGAALIGTKTIVGSGLAFRFCTGAGTYGPLSQIIETVPQDTCRVMRRRTLRIGE